MVYIIHECNFVMIDGNPENARCSVCGKSILEGVVLPEPEPERKLEFIKYRSIENSYRNRFIEKIREEGLNEGIWIATNKIHGANFQCCADSENIRFAKRSAFIADDENFYGLHTNLIRMKEFLTDRIRRIQNYFGGTVNVYFELFGGSYPHPEVPRSNVSAIQGGVFYTPNVDIRVLDIFANGEFIDFDEMCKIVVHYNLKPVKELNRGSFDAMLALDPIFDDPTYMDYGLPKIEGNVSEGFVIRPSTEKKLKTGERLVLKQKNPKFSEKSRAPVVKKETKVLPPELQEVFDDLCSCINENRLRNILSHGDVFSNKDFGKLQGMMMEDIIKEEGDALMEFEKADRKKITDKMLKEIANFIRPNFLNIIDGVS